MIVRHLQSRRERSCDTSDLGAGLKLFVDKWPARFPFRRNKESEQSKNGKEDSSNGSGIL